MFAIMEAAGEIEARGRSVIHLEVGGTDGFLNEDVISEFARLASTSSLGYVPSGGIPALRNAFARQYTLEKGIQFDERNAVVAPANALITQAMFLSCDRGDSVLVPDPGFPTYRLAAEFAGVEAIPYPMRPDLGWQPDPAEVESLLRNEPRCRLLILNTPSNPLGSVIDDDVIDDITGVAESLGVRCLLDETYKNLVFSGRRPNPVHRPGISYLYSLSKDSAVPGLRVGCLVSEEKDLVGKVVDFNSLLFSCGNGIAQEAAIVAVGASELTARIRRELATRTELFGEMTRGRRFSHIVPEAGFYLFIDVGGFGMDGQEFSLGLLEERAVCVCPGEAFGRRCGNFVRVTMSGAREAFIDGVRGLVDYAENLAERPSGPHERQDEHQ